MIQSSIFIQFALWIWRTLQSAFLVRMFYKGFDKICIWFRKSWIFKALFRTKSIDSYAETSLFYKACGSVWNGVLAFFSKLYAACARLCRGGVTQSIYEKFFAPSFFFHAEVFCMAAIAVIFMVPHTMWNNMYALIIAVGLFAIYFLCLLGGKKDFGKSVTGLWSPLLCFMFITTASVLASPTMGDSIRVLVFFWTAFLLCLLVYGMMTSAKRLDALCGVMLFVSAFTAVLAVLQRVMGLESDASLTDLALNKGMPGRAFATLGNPNNYAEFLMLFIPFGFVWAQNRKKMWHKCIGFFMVLLSIGALVLTYSRSGWLAFAASCIVFTALYKRRLLPVLFLAAIFCIPLLPQTVLNRILTIGNLADSSSSYRIDIWTGCLAMLRDGYWLAGVGLGPAAFQAVYPAYAIGKTRIAPHSHMQFMEMLIEMGILGFISLLWFSVSLIRRTSAYALRETAPSQKRMLCAAAASISGITLIGFAEYTWFYPRVQLAFFIAAGIAMAAVRLSVKAKGK